MNKTVPKSRGSAVELDETLRRIVAGTASLIGDEFFRSLVRHLTEALEVRYAFVAEFAGSQTRVRTRMPVRERVLLR